MKIEEYGIKHNLKTDEDWAEHGKKVAFAYCGICHEVLPNGARDCPICNPEDFKKAKSSEVIIECVKCSRTAKEDSRYDFHHNPIPQGTKKIKYYCPFLNCPHHSEENIKKHPPRFFDKNGTEIVM